MKQGKRAIVVGPMAKNPTVGLEKDQAVKMKRDRLE